MTCLPPIELIIADRSVASQDDCSEIDDSMHLQSLGSSLSTLGSFEVHDNVIHLSLRWGNHEESYHTEESPPDCGPKVPRRQQTDESIRRSSKITKTTNLEKSVGDMALKMPRRQQTKDSIPVGPRRQQTKESIDVHSASGAQADNVGRLLETNRCARRVRTTTVPGNSSGTTKRIPRRKRRALQAADSSATLRRGNISLVDKEVGELPQEEVGTDCPVLVSPMSTQSDEEPSSLLTLSGHSQEEDTSTKKQDFSSSTEETTSLRGLGADMSLKGAIFFQSDEGDDHERTLPGMTGVSNDDETPAITNSRLMKRVSELVREAIAGDDEVLRNNGLPGGKLYLSLKVRHSSSTAAESPFALDHKIFVR